MRDYLFKLKAPDNWLDFVDLLSKTIVAAAAGNAKATVEFASGVNANLTPADTRAGATYVRSPAATAQVSKLAAVEAAGGTSSSPNWYAVVASVPITQPDAAGALARSLNEQLSAVTGTCDVHVFQTKISNSFAITSGDAKTEASAKARVNLIRGAGVVPTPSPNQTRNGWRPPFLSHGIG